MHRHRAWMMRSDFLFFFIIILPFISLSQYLQVYLDNIPVVKLESMMLCFPESFEVEMHVSAQDLQISASNSNVSYTEPKALREALAKLNATMQQPVFTYVGGLPGILPCVFSLFFRFNAK